MLREADYPFPASTTTFIGALIQKYRPRNGRASAAFQRWIDQLVKGLKDELVPALERAGFVDPERFHELAGFDPWTPIMEVSDFNSLIAESQEHQVPVYALSAELLNQKGAVWERTRESMLRFEAAFTNCAEVVIRLSS